MRSNGGMTIISPLLANYLGRHVDSGNTRCGFCCIGAPSGYVGRATYGSGADVSSIASR